MKRGYVEDSGEDEYDEDDDDDEEDEDDEGSTASGTPDHVRTMWNLHTSHRFMLVNGRSTNCSLSPIYVELAPQSYRKIGIH